MQCDIICQLAPAVGTYIFDWSQRALSSIIRLTGTPNPSSSQDSTVVFFFFNRRKQRQWMAYPCLPQMSHCVHAPLALIYLDGCGWDPQLTAAMGNLDPSASEICFNLQSRAQLSDGGRCNPARHSPAQGPYQSAHLPGGKIVIPNSRTQRPQSVVN
jgi:hypothetical protein